MISVVSSMLDTHVCLDLRALAAQLEDKLLWKCSIQSGFMIVLALVIEDPVLPRYTLGLGQV